MTDINSMSDMSSYLYAQPSFISGLGRALDLFGQFDDYNTTTTPEQADARAFQADWQAVGDDLRRAAQAIDTEENTVADARSK